MHILKIFVKTLILIIKILIINSLNKICRNMKIIKNLMSKYIKILLYDFISLRIINQRYI